MPVYVYECETCTTPSGYPYQYDHLHRPKTYEGGEWVDHGETAPDVMPCKVCAGPAHKLPSMPAFRIARTDFVDPTLGVRFKDEGSLKRYCRDQGLSEDLGGETQFEMKKQIDARAAQDAKDEAEYNEYVDKLNNAEEFSDYRRLRDRGYFTDRMKKRAESVGVATKVTAYENAVTPTPSE